MKVYSRKPTFKDIGDSSQLSGDRAAAAVSLAGLVWRSIDQFSVLTARSTGFFSRFSDRDVSCPASCNKMPQMSIRIQMIMIATRRTEPGVLTKERN